MGLPNRLITLVLMAPALVAMAAAPSVPPAPATTAGSRPPAQEQRLDELDEVLVEGRRNRERARSWDDYQQPFDFLATLVGQFVVEGQVDLHAQGNNEDLRKVSGRANCLGFGSAPGVQCELTVRWPETSGPGGEEIPGGVSALDPAVLLFGFDPATPGISHVMLDNKGIADTAVGRMTSPNTMMSRSKCVGIPGNCERTVRITVEPDLKTIRMHVDLAIDQQKSVRFLFVMNRVPGSVAVVYGRKQEKEKKK
jgi:hypothetical protein